ncbi:hypothetical protein FA15DRAFT_733086 [Coprinopsis marcescibilis]|uniref:Uncharacterized protein n=1 Tax=Coprinopsis marcescibilis TaxID=230819 RepID=A0A5C3KCI0_COPMA|nr:hypothetical protein FA15DRAFT_733086 [Coprinopsis marcescibilis]
MVQHWDSLVERGDAALYVSSVTTGIEPGVQAKFDALRNRLTGRADYEFSLSRDYDSAHIISPNICVRGQPIYFHVIHKFHDALSKNIGITYSIPQPTNLVVPLHQIPNYCFAKWGIRHSIRIFYPRLHTEDRRSHILTVDECATWYEKVVRPALSRLAPERTNNLPATYSTETFRSRTRNGMLFISGRTISDWDLQYLGDYMRELVAENDMGWAEGFFFLHEIRGVKNSSVHTPSATAATTALGDFLTTHGIPPEVRTEAGVLAWVDVGIEISSDVGDCLAPRADTIPALISQFSSIPIDKATSMAVAGNGKFYLDPISCMTQVAGCRLSPGVRGRGPYGVIKLQAYVTDKAVTATPDEGTGRHAKHITLNDMLNNRHERFLTNLYETYIDCVGEVTSNVRFEVRVPLEFGDKVMLHYDSDVIRDCLVSLDSRTWWHLRAHRALAFKLTIDWHLAATVIERSKMSALLLLAAASWVINSLHAAPDSGPSCRKLMNAILPRQPRASVDADTIAYRMSLSAPAQEDDEEDDEGEILSRQGPLRLNSRRPSRYPTRDEEEDDDDEFEDDMQVDTVPCNPYGLIFLREIRIGEAYPIPRFCSSSSGFLDEKTFRYFFGTTFSDFKQYVRSMRVAKISNPQRVKNKVVAKSRFTKLNLPQVPIFNVAGTQQPIEIREDSDNDTADDSEGEDAADKPLDIFKLPFDQLLDIIYHNMFSQLASTSPNPKPGTRGPYILLTIEEREDVHEGVFKKRNLAKIWDTCRFKVLDETEWRRLFERFFPAKGQDTGSRAQNYSNCPFISDWTQVLELAVYAPYWEAGREALWRRFKRLYWMPAARADRIWTTSGKRESGFVYPPGESGTAPLLYVRESAPTWNRNAVSVPFSFSSETLTHVSPQLA